MIDSSGMHIAYKKISAGIIAAIVVILLYGAVSPSFTPVLRGTADGMAHKYRLVNFDRSVRDGNIRPRWIGNAALGYGAPLFIFNYSVPYYLVDTLYRGGLSIRTASQVYAAFTILASAFTMYVLATRLWGIWAGCISALIYTYAPYHLLTVYSYEAWGEMLAFVFPPLILNLLLRAHTESTRRPVRNKIWYAACVITWVIFILTHNISSFITSPFIILFALVFHGHGRDSVRLIVKIVLFVVLLSAFFILPAVREADTIRIADLMAEEMSLRDLHMVPFVTQIRISYAALSGSHIKFSEFTAGMVIFLSILIGGVMLLWKPFRNKEGYILSVLLGTAVTAIFLTTPASYTLYGFRPLQYVLYPYRFLFLATFSGSMLAGMIFKKSVPAGICIITLAVIFGSPFTRPYLDIFPFPPSFFDQPQMIHRAEPTRMNMGTAEFLPASADMAFLDREELRYLGSGVLPDKIIFPEGNGTIYSLSVRQESVVADIGMDMESDIIISTNYYPDWRSYIDGVRTQIDKDGSGRIRLRIPKGRHTIRLEFGYGKTEIIGILISAIGGILFLATLFI